MHFPCVIWRNNSIDPWNLKLMLLCIFGACLFEPNRLTHEFWNFSFDAFIVLASWKQIHWPMNFEIKALMHFPCVTYETTRLTDEFWHFSFDAFSMRNSAKQLDWPMKFEIKALMHFWCYLFIYLFGTSGTHAWW